MSSTIWLKLRNKESGVVKIFEEDFTGLAKELPRRGEVCRKHHMRDINQFVDYSEALNSFSNELMDERNTKPFQWILIQEAIDTLSIRIKNTEDALQTESCSLLEKCKSGTEKYEEMCLMYIL